MAQQANQMNVGGIRGMEIRSDERQMLNAEAQFERDRLALQNATSEFGIHQAQAKMARDEKKFEKEEHKLQQQLQHQQMLQMEKGMANQQCAQQFQVVNAQMGYNAPMQQGFGMPQQQMMNQQMMN